MSNLVKYPLQDGYESTLAQAWDGQVGTLTVNASPSFTFPSGVTTYIVVDPGKTTMQIGEINAYDAGLKTITVNNITLEKGAGINSTAVNHTVGAKVIISDNYQFWKDILDAINGKIDTEDAQHAVYADDAARDAVITSPSNGMEVYNTTDGAFNDYIGGAWVIRATGAVVNATDAIAGKIELPTDAEVTAKTATGGTGATVCPTNAQIGKSVALKAVDATLAETDHLVFDNAGTDNKMLVSVFRDQLAGSKTIKGTFEMLTDAEATTGTDETRVLNSKQAKDNYEQLISMGTTTRAAATASSTESIAHGLSRTPKVVRFYFCETSSNSSLAGGFTGVSDSSSDFCTGHFSGDTINMSVVTSIHMFSGTSGHFATATLDATNVNIIWTKVNSGVALSVIWVAEA